MRNDERKDRILWTAEHGPRKAHGRRRKGDHQVMDIAQKNYGTLELYRPSTIIMEVHSGLCPRTRAAYRIYTKEARS